MDTDGENIDKLLYPKTKKRKSHGRMADVLKKIRITSHEEGTPCNCRMKCFEKILPESRRIILQKFNMLTTRDLQNSYLCSLISVLPVNRPSKTPTGVHYDAVYQYKIRSLETENEVKEQRVCKKAFMGIHGISRKKVEYLQSSLKNTGIAPTDKRGRHGNQAKLSYEIKSLIRQHINSFKGRASHYSLHNSSRTYLPEDLNIKKMYNMFITDHEDDVLARKVSYEFYRTIFNNDFNISFGYPRTDTCSMCDQFKVKLNALESSLKSTTDIEKVMLLKNEIHKLSIEKKLHLMKAESFYSRKRIARIYARDCSHATEAICFDYGKNLCVPNIQTNDVYYKRQLTVAAFNIHVLNSKRSIFYLYPETEGKKGSDDVCSMVHHYIYNFMKSTTKHLQLFCDSCSGQNKNFTMFRFLHHLVHVEKKLDSITITFPVRGHSYMENDKNMGLINAKARAEIPEDWVEIFECARQRPFPFDVVSVNKSFFKSWTEHLNQTYAKKSSFPSRPIKELKVECSSTKILYRVSYNGAWEKACVAGRGKQKISRSMNGNEFCLPIPCYDTEIPISKEKYEDLQVLKKFCSNKAQEYFTNITHK